MELKPFELYGEFGGVNGIRGKMTVSPLNFPVKMIA